MKRIAALALVVLVLGTLVIACGAKDKGAPTVSLTYAPANPTTSQPVTFTATASDPSGIQNIEIWVAGAKVSECTSSPCTYTGGPYAEGTVIYEAKAKDTAGNWGTSSPQSFVVVPPSPGPDITGPTVTITTSPANPTTSQQVTFTATATDPSGIQSIEIWVAGAKVSECTSSPCTYTGGPYADGNVIYEAKAKDTLGNPGTSGSNSLVGPSDVTGPTVTITTSPANPTTSQPVTFTATATDPSGIQNIEIWVAGVMQTECTSSPCTYTGGPYAEGNVIYEAKAKDTLGNPGTSGPQPIVIGSSDVTGPTVTITTSPAYPNYTEPITFTVTASDPSGIQNIEIWVAGAKVSECTSSPCTYTGGPYLKGTVSYEAKAKDTVGNPGTSGSKSLPVVQAVGNISVTSNPSGASILLDGAMSYGTTPFGVAKVLTNVIAGQHTLKLSKDHYKYMQANITVTAGQTTYINWSLTPAPDTQLVIQPGPSAAKECTVRILNQATQTAYPGQLQIGGGNSAAGDEVDRGFLRFDLSSIPATAHITEANIGLCYSFTYYYTSFHLPAPIGLYKVTGNWDRSTITWGNQPASEGSAVSTTTVPGSEDDSFYYWPATALVQGWLNGSIPNYGIVLKDTDESTYEGVKIFASTVWDPNYYNKQITSTQYPKLVITYWDPTP